MKVQQPAVGIMKTSDFGDSKFYDVACDCGLPEHTLKVNVEADEMGVTVHIWTTVKTTHWKKWFDYDFDDKFYWIKDTTNDWINRFSICWTALTKGYIETEATTILKQQAAFNFAYTLISAVTDVKEIRSKEDKKEADNANAI